MASWYESEMCVRIARWTQPDLKALAVRKRRAQLLLIPYSHYCELARWSLEVAGIAFDEHGYSPGAHMPVTLALRIGDSRGKAYHHHMQSSTCQVADRAPSLNQSVQLDGRRKGWERRSDATLLPAVCLPDGTTVLTDSWAVVNHCWPNASWPLGFRACIDEELGVLGRQLGYTAIFRPANSAIWDGFCLDSAGPLFWTFYKLGAGTILKKNMIALFRADDKEAEAYAFQRIRAVIAKIESTWLHGDAYDSSTPCSAGWTVGGGSKPDAPDYAMATLTAVLVWPPEYCAGRYKSYIDRLLEQDDAFRKQTEFFRTTRVGRHCLHMYSMYRRCPPPYMSRL